jgi:hypothetical protein
VFHASLLLFKSFTAFQYATHLGHQVENTRCTEVSYPLHTMDRVVDIFVSTRL